MKKKLLVVFLLAGASLLAETRVFVEFGVGPSGYRYAPPPPPPRVMRIAPRYPGPGYVWVQGYWYPSGRDYRWREGYWERRHNRHERWVAPRYRHGRYYFGYWRR